jgi:hypothetical protein
LVNGGHGEKYTSILPFTAATFLCFIPNSCSPIVALGYNNSDVHPIPISS